MDDSSHGARPFWKSRSAVALVAFAAIALFLLLSEHRPPLPWGVAISAVALVPADASVYAPWARAPWDETDRGAS